MAGSEVTMKNESERRLRSSVVAAMVKLSAAGLNRGTAGNIGVRNGETLLVTPSGVPCEALRPEQLASISLKHDDGRFDGPMQPSSEWRFHHAILKERPDVAAVVHTHSTYATAVSILRRDITAVHYMIAAFGGPTIRCARYETFGTQELADAVIDALRDRNGCLLANHGMIVCGPTLDKAMWLAVELEELARQFVLTSLLGGCVVLTDEEIERVRLRFGSYAPDRESRLRD
jgi:L-fuculose-phosphate aldolase